MHHYFDINNTLTSVYLFDTNVQGFGGCFLVKKQIEGGTVKIGTWDSIHVVSVDLEKHDGKARYRVTSTVFLKMLASNQDAYGNLEIAGNLSRSREETYNMDARAQKDGDDFHIANIGRLIEQNETEIRSEMDSIYINKTKQIVNTGRLKEEYMSKDEKVNFHNELAAAVAGLKKL